MAVGLTEPVVTGAELSFLVLSVARLRLKALRGRRSGANLAEAFSASQSSFPLEGNRELDGSHSAP